MVDSVCSYICTLYVELRILKWDPFFSDLVFIHNHKVNSATQPDLEGHKEIMEPKELEWEQRSPGIENRGAGGGDALLSYRRNGLLNKMPASQRIRAVHSRKWWASCWSSHFGPQTLYGFHKAYAFSHLQRPHTCYPTTVSWNHLCLVQRLQWTRCQDLYASGWSSHP